MNATDNSISKPKPKLTLDGVLVEFEPGETIMKVAERARADGSIPRYCYHPGLPIAGTCRMCTVEVEKAPKLMTSCSTPASDGMVVHTESERVKKSRAGVMETLLANHPLDCPVCDQAGECSLQNYNYEYGPGTSEFIEEKREFVKSSTKALSDKITLNMNRCIHCERCVRFTEDITKTHELLMNQRGWKKELSTALEGGLTNDYQGNLADICPVGALTFTDFRFKKRVWFLKKSPTLCDGCSKGCSVYADSDADIVYRYRARFQKEVNGHWICDEGRVSFHSLQKVDRIALPHCKADAGSSAAPALQATNWEKVVTWLLQQFAKSQKNLLLIGTDATLDEAKILLEGLPGLTKSSWDVRSWNGTPGIETSDQDISLDPLLRQKDKTPNTRGLEKLGIIPLQESNSNYDLCLFFRSGRSALYEKRLGIVEVGWGVFSSEEGKRFDAILPGLTTLEKSGSYLNCQGIEQKFEAAISPRESCASVNMIVEGIKAKLGLGDYAKG